MKDKPLEEYADIFIKQHMKEHNMSREEAEKELVKIFKEIIEESIKAKAWLEEHGFKTDL